MAFTDNTTGGRVILEGILPVTVVLTDACEVGDLIGYEGVTDNEWQRADANGKALAQLIAAERCETSGDTIKCYKMAVVDGFTDATTGDMVYLSDDVGAYASTPASWVMQCVGQMVSDTKAFINPSCSPVTGYPSTGTSWAGYFRSELESGRTGVASAFGGVRIDVKTIATGVSGGDIYGLYVFGQLLLASAGTSYLLRLEDACNTSCGFDAYIGFITGASDDPDYLFDLAPTSLPANGAWASEGTAKTGDGGFIKVKTPTGTRYINMYVG